MKRKANRYIQQSTEIRIMAIVPQICFQFVATVGEAGLNLQCHSTRH